MKKVEIGFWGMESILEFVAIAAKCTEKMNLSCGDRIVDAKSLLSVFSLAVADGAELIILEDSCDFLLNRLELYIDHGRLLGSKNIAV